MRFNLLFGKVSDNLHDCEKPNPKATKTVYPIICQIVNTMPTQFISETAKHVCGRKEGVARENFSRVGGPGDAPIHLASTRAEAKAGTLLHLTYGPPRGRGNPGRASPV